MILCETYHKSHQYCQWAIYSWGKSQKEGWTILETFKIEENNKLVMGQPYCEYAPYQTFTVHLSSHKKIKMTKEE